MLFSLLRRLAVLALVAILRPVGTEIEPGRTRVSSAWSLYVGEVGVSGGHGDRLVSHQFLYRL